MRLDSTKEEKRGKRERGKEGKGERGKGKGGKRERGKDYLYFKSSADRLHFVPGHLRDALGLDIEGVDEVVLSPRHFVYLPFSEGLLFLK